MKSSASIHFIGRRQGLYPFTNSRWFLENSRNKELAGLRKVNNLKIVNSIKKADIIFFRHKPENTTDSDFKRLFNIEKNSTKKIINPISSFYNYDLKDRSFSLWEKNGLSTPSYIKLNIYNKDVKEEYHKIANFIKKYERILLRTNNETGSKGIFYLDSACSENDIIKSFDSIRNRMIVRLENHGKTNIIAVEYIKSNSTNAYNYLNRVHVIDNHLLGGYVIVNKKNIFHAKHMQLNDYNEFIIKNKELSHFLKDDKIIKKIMKSFQVLGNNLGAIEFFINNNEMIFLELNPMWAGNYNCFGEIQGRLLEQEKVLSKEIPMIYNWLNKKKYYKKMYEHLLQSTVKK